MSTLQDFKIDTIQGGGNLIPDLDGKVVLAVNVASKCGLTPHYAGLESLYEENESQGLVVVGFPCNQFGEQEPGTEDEIVTFCTTNYGVKFPMTTKIDVNGEGQHPIYAWLTGDENSFPGDIDWNFEKFLIDRNGKVIKRYPPATTPEDSGLLQDIADQLS
jgi:glutathione peroxidase